MSGILSDPGVQSVEMNGKVVWVKPDKNGWQPIETAPKDGTWVLLFEPDEDPNYQRFWVAQHADDRWWVHGREYTAWEPTHWQPLPSPPK